MADDSKYPKAAALRKMREDREEARLQRLKDDAKTAVTIKPRPTNPYKRKKKSR